MSCMVCGVSSGQATPSERYWPAARRWYHVADREHRLCVCSKRVPSPAGALIWHGKDLRHYRRLLSPPLQRLLTCPGAAALGRGVASMPLAAARRMGTGQVRPCLRSSLCDGSSAG